MNFMVFLVYFRDNNHDIITYTILQGGFWQEGCQGKFPFDYLLSLLHPKLYCLAYPSWNTYSSWLQSQCTPSLCLGVCEEIWKERNGATQTNSQKTIKSLEWLQWPGTCSGLMHQKRWLTCYRRILLRQVCLQCQLKGKEVFFFFILVIICISLKFVSADNGSSI